MLFLAPRFQPFLRFYKEGKLKDLNGRELKEVSTLLEILRDFRQPALQLVFRAVSTLLEILRVTRIQPGAVANAVAFQPFLRFYRLEGAVVRRTLLIAWVSTLLEILLSNSSISNTTRLFLRFNPS